MSPHFIRKIFAKYVENISRMYSLLAKLWTNIPVRLRMRLPVFLNEWMYCDVGFYNKTVPLDEYSYSSYFVEKSSWTPCITAFISYVYDKTNNLMEFNFKLFNNIYTK